MRLPGRWEKTIQIVKSVEWMSDDDAGLGLIFVDNLIRLLAAEEVVWCKELGYLLGYIPSRFMGN